MKKIIRIILNLSLLSLLYTECVFSATPGATDFQSVISRMENQDTENRGQGDELYKLYLEQGIYYIQKSNYTKAKYFLLKALNRNNKEPEVYLNLGVIALKRQNIVHAMRLLKKALRLAPQDYDKTEIILYNIGLCYQRMGNDPKAFEYYRQALARNSSFAQALLGLGIIYEKSGQYEAALLHLAKARYILEETQETEYLEKSENALQDFITNHKDIAQTMTQKLFDKGSALFEEKKAERAIEILKLSSAIDTHNPLSYYRLGVLYLDRNDMVTAAKYFIATIKADKNYIQAYNNLAGIFTKLKKYPDALKILTAAAEVDKENPKIYYNMGIIYLETGEKRKGRECLIQAKRLAQKQHNTDLLKKIKQAL
ncbi:MAG: tetratricopeptide repeat protein [Candidatus Omnitrophota bacterium]